MISNNIGLAPGSLVYTGKDYTSDTSINLISFNDTAVSEERLGTEDLANKVNEESTTWFNISGLHQTDVIAKVGLAFGINTLIMEDVLNVNQLPKTEELGNHLFVTLKMFHMSDVKHEITEEHISFVLGKGYIISFQENESDVFDSVRNRIRAKHGKIRTRGNDYLLYALMDALIDNYLLITKTLEVEIETLEDQVFGEEHEGVAKNIILMRKKLTRLRRFIQPSVFATQSLRKMDSDLLSEQIQPFLSDLIDHSSRAADRISEQRETLSNYMDLHLSLQGQKMNEIMKVLTIVAAIFIPLTFLAGIYGMNFNFMPELQFKWSYPILLVIMFTLGAGLIFYFKKKKWL